MLMPYTTCRPGKQALPCKVMRQHTQLFTVIIAAVHESVMRTILAMRGIHAMRHMLTR